MMILMGIPSSACCSMPVIQSSHPRTVGTREVLDPAHLRYAADHDLLLLTANAKDFLALHAQWQQDGQDHPGMLLVYRENKPQRDMTFQEITRAVSRLDQAGIPLRNTYQNLNFWREPRR